MFRIRVEKVLKKNISDVFRFLEDHENYDNFPNIGAAKLLKHGDAEKNGTGALRELIVAGIKFDERITCHERPSKLSYRIEKSRPIPFDHDFGTIELFEEGESTRVVWVSEGKVDVPILGRVVLNKVAQRQGTVGFRKILNWIESQP